MALDASTSKTDPDTSGSSTMEKSPVKAVITVPTVRKKEGFGKTVNFLDI